LSLSVDNPVSSSGSPQGFPANKQAYRLIDSLIYYSRMIISTKYSGITSTQLKPFGKQLELYRKHLVDVKKKNVFEAPESSINLPFSKEVEQIIAKAKNYRTKELRTVVVIGIGGSNLGTQAVYEALGKKNVELCFLDTVSSTQFGHIIEKLTKQHTNKNQFLIVSISKSGGTTETIANTEALLSTLRKTFVDVQSRLVVITDEYSKYHEAASRQHIDCLTMPNMVGGRFSVFSAVGLFPLAVAGFDIRKLCAGAREAVESALVPSLTKNQAASLAITTFLQQKNGFNIHNTFFFAPELESLGKWERQLIGESLGKEKDLSGKIVRAGITPIVSIGSTDLHSMGQLYFGGPKDKFTTIVSVKDARRVVVPKEQIFPALVEHLAGKSLAEIMHAIVLGVTEAYKKAKLPFVEFVFEKLNEQSVGMFMQTRMLEVVYLAQLLNVNAFDQPSVEGYKIETKKRLK
jgi:glucose-6-phosphate isomerase